ncbi:MAG: substrate-binding domain-containing protein [Clostridia bacterium]|nr:substrate-binding domain-containing protein [Clostridia bacterium]
MHVLVEAPFLNSHWCSHYIKGITAQAKRKNIDVEIHTDVNFVKDESFKDTHVILIGSSMTWASSRMNYLYERDVRPIVLSIANYQKQFPYASFITMDYDDAAMKLMKYFRDKGCEHTAFFAVDMKSSTDMQKLGKYLQSGGKETDVFPFKDSLGATCDRLIARLKEYDSILCANDVSSVVLLRRLMDLGYSIPRDIHMASFGDTTLSNLEIHNIAVAKVKSFDAGRLSINAYRMLKSDPEISSLSFSLHCDIFDCNCERTDIHVEHTVPTFDNTPSTNFFRDPDVEKVLLVEKLLAGCDKLDISILREVLNKESYSKIASKLFIAENTISYRIKKILSLAPDKSKEEVFALLSQFLF